MQIGGTTIFLPFSTVEVANLSNNLVFKSIKESEGNARYLKDKGILEGFKRNQKMSLTLIDGPRCIVQFFLGISLLNLLVLSRIEC